jgi:protocatechuate 3,4-dioxygenase, alpha subunit
MSQPQTPSQTVGPFFHDALMRAGVSDVDPDRTAGTPISISGQVLDGDGEPVSDAMIELWQADGAGRYRHPADGRQSDVPTSFIGFGRVATSDAGGFELTTAMPGTVPGRGGSVQAPHLNVHVFARGLLDQLWTRIYFAGNPANGDDPILRSLPEERRHTLLADPVDGDGEVQAYRFDVVLQGANETVFFAT